MPSGFPMQHRLAGPGMSGPQGPPPTSAQIQKILDENCGLIQTIQDFQNMGKLQECMSYQHALHKNLVYLASLADASSNIQVIPVSISKNSQKMQNV